MTRKFLTSLGVESDLIDKIMDAHGEGIEREKTKAEAGKQALSEQVEALKADLAKAEAATVSEVERVRKEFEGGEDFKAKYEAEVELHNATKESLKVEKEAHKATQDGYATEKDNESVDGLVKALLAEKNMHPSAIDKAVKLYDRAIVERKDGVIANADKIVEAFQADWKDFFGEVHVVGANVGTPPASAASGKKDYKKLIDEARKAGKTQEAVALKYEASKEGIFLP